MMGHMDPRWQSQENLTSKWRQALPRYRLTVRSNPADKGVTSTHNIMFFINLWIRAQNSLYHSFHAIIRNEDLASKSSSTTSRATRSLRSRQNRMMQKYRSCVIIYKLHNIAHIILKLILNKLSNRAVRMYTCSRRLAGRRLSAIGRTVARWGFTMY